MQRVTQSSVSQPVVSSSEIHAAKRKARNDAIDRFVADATARGDCADRLYWTLIYDFEHAALTTNLKQLEESGVRPPAAQSMNDAELFDSLWEVISALGELGIFLLHSNHLTDRILYERLVQQILIEPVRDLPPDSGVHEFIDMLGGGGPIEREIYQRYYAEPAERAQFAKEYGFEIAPETAPSDRDRDLPKPNRVESHKQDETKEQQESDEQDHPNRIFISGSGGQGENESQKN